MNLSAVKAFVHAAEEGSISDAAKKMRKNRVQVSQWIASLEDEFGVALFNRSKRNPELTAAGQQIKLACEALLAAEHLVNQTALSLQQGCASKLNVGISYLLPPSIISVVVDTLRSSFPHTEIAIVQLRDEELLQKFSEQSLCVCVFCYMHALSVPAETIELGQQVNQTVCSPQYAMAKKAHLSTKDLLNFTYISMTSQATQASWELPNIRHRISVNSLQGVKALVSNATGFATLPEWLIEQDLQQQCLVPISYKNAQVIDKIGLLIQPLAYLNTVASQLTCAVKPLCVNTPEPRQ